MRTVACWLLLAWTGVGLRLKACAAVLAGMHASIPKAAVVQRGCMGPALQVRPLPYLLKNVSEQGRTHVCRRSLAAGRVLSIWLSDIRWHG